MDALSSGNLTMQDEQSAELSGLLDKYGLDVAPVTREDQVYGILTEGLAPKIDNCRYWLGHQMALFQYLTKDADKKITTDTIVDGKAVAKQLSNLDYAKLMIKYYLSMHHLPWFQDLQNGTPKADMTKVIDMLLQHEALKAVVEKKW